VEIMVGYGVVFDGTGLGAAGAALWQHCSVFARHEYASDIWIRPLPVRSSLPDAPRSRAVPSRQDRTCKLVHDGHICHIAAAAPATWGDANEVPSAYAYRFSSETVNVFPSTVVSVAPSSVVTPMAGIVMTVPPFSVTSNAPGTLLTMMTTEPPADWQLSIMVEK
jgi:hypothetical protein